MADICLVIIVIVKSNIILNLKIYEYNEKYQLS